MSANSLMEMVDSIKDKINDKEYLDLCNELKKLHNVNEKEIEIERERFGLYQESGLWRLYVDSDSAGYERTFILRKQPSSRFEAICYFIFEVKDNNFTQELRCAALRTLSQSLSIEELQELSIIARVFKKRKISKCVRLLIECRFYS